MALLAAPISVSYTKPDSMSRGQELRVSLKRNTSPGSARHDIGKGDVLEAEVLSALGLAMAACEYSAFA
ncbi:hypothetical protein [Mycobacterium kyorinense]|uniref:hypothetical protein n=1 Tax=Mycobacterium kyorinense TaxID=487514 RepID=UPI001269C605|nr:hypothetical protein [Mycobacterium kyorinense]